MGGKKKDNKQDTDKQVGGDSGKNKARSGRGDKGHAAVGFRMPDPLRTLQVCAPAIMPPVLLEDCDDEEAVAAAAEAEALGAMPKKLDLSLVALLTRPVSICAIDNFMTLEECCTWIAWGEQHGFEEAKQKQNAVYAFRDNGRIEFNSPDIAYNIWLRMRVFLPEEVGNPPRKMIGCSPRIRVYRYTRGQRFGQHVDGSRDEPEMGGRTHFTVLVYLNGGHRDGDGPEMQLRGGETVFWKDNDMRKPALAFPPMRGVLLFHGHGDDCMTHEGAGVEDGVKYILRTDAVCEKEAEA